MVFASILNNRPFWAAIIAWAIAQGFKTIRPIVTQRKFDATRLVGTGGMPSSHSSLVMALTVSIGKYYGFDSALFAISLIFSCVVMYDAAGIRRAAGKQAEILNYLIEHHKLPNFDKVKELLGHTPLEVLVGAILGSVVGWLV